MDDFCWLTGPGLCGTMSFNLPIVEVLAVGLVSGAIAAATIWASFRAAKYQTDKALGDSVVRELRSVVGDIADNANDVFKNGDLGSFQDSPLISRSTTAYNLIRTSGLANAFEVVAWADLMLEYSLMLKEFGLSVSSKTMEPIESVVLERIGPHALISKRLAQWLADPSQVGQELKDEFVALHDHLHEQHHIHEDRVAQILSKRRQETNRRPLLSDMARKRRRKPAQYRS
ncbi:hypothetical protein [Leucobacter aridicollis]|uniref:2-succinyl-5-enolpyruvyl-6-hydroxy-3-cyclohexene-1-carboxylate synthase n=1 Tax=Leucobacter aridicollis TaxID=283878 RepID=A0A852QXH5_9MICO|nr:hypothetical protein [Leucobacter aridicollis]MBL3682626.1 hypothetical protein [Leucobacter aridicollis]NYD26051.1 2-succinyl-5-enolpyruvyl-6-hydroxy-3-cyclohexene-1-carboxylate synthase [Leucobacter aridicollis]